MKKIFSLGLLLLLALAPLLAQNAMRREDKIKVVVNGDTLLNAWAGGLHAPQFSEADIDGDGHKDLVVFNRGILATSANINGFKLLTFKNNGTPNQVDYEYKPEWESIFPPLVFWVKLYDLNCDNIPDLLSSNQLQLPSINWYEGLRDNNGMLYFEFRDTLNTSNPFVPVELQRSDYPGVGDVDRDGDVDFINCNSGFGLFSYYKGVSTQATGTCGDTIGHDIDNYCWGEVSLVAAGVQTGYICPFTPLPIGGGGGNPRHNGGAALVIDLDGDGDDDLVYGEVDKKNLFALYNGGDSMYAVIDSVDANYPVYDVPASISHYPLAFGFDANNDGKKDIIVAPNDSYNCASKNTVLFYENNSNTNAIQLQFKQNNFLEDGMIELGQGAFPTFVDYNGDSLIDLVVGNYGYYRDSTVVSSQLALFINVGTAEVPVFELTDDDWLGFASRYPAEVVMALYPAFGDIDTDGDLDLFLGDTSGTITFYENTAGLGAPMAFAPPVANYFNIDVMGSGYSAPLVYDVNGDGLMDLLIGNRVGTIRYFENRGTASAPAFDQVPTNNLFGAIDVSTAFTLFGYSQPVITVLDTTGTLYLLSGNEEGNIYGYEFNIDSIYSGSFTQLFNKYSGIDAGERTAITVADITNDGKPEMIVGNHRGGLEFFTLSDTIENIVSVPTVNSEGMVVEAYPNPTASEVFVTVQGTLPGQVVTYQVLGMLGNVVTSGTLEPVGASLQANIYLAAEPVGIYLVRISQGAAHTSLKLIKY